MKLVDLPGMTWHEATITKLNNILSNDEAVLGIFQLGSFADVYAQVDAWSDLDLLLVVADEAIETFHPSSAWREILGEVYAIDSYQHPDYSTHRTFYTDGRHIDWLIAAESSFTRLATWSSNPLAYGFNILYASSERIRDLARGAKPALPFSLPSDEDFEHLVNAFRFKGMLAVTKAARNDLLIAEHLALDLVRDCLLLAMWLRDRETGTVHHRDGHAGNHYMPALVSSAQPYTREGVLTSIAYSAEAFNTLAAQWSPDYLPQRTPLLEMIAHVREYEQTEVMACKCHESITLATLNDLPEIMGIITAVIQQMESVGIQQWDAVYPDSAKFSQDICENCLYALKRDGELIALMALNEQQADAYAGINWQYPVDRVLVVHRLAVHPAQQGQGVAQRMMMYAEDFARTEGYQAIRLDAFLDNPRAVKLYEQQGYEKAGLLHFRKGQFWAFEKQIDLSISAS